MPPSEQDEKEKKKQHEQEISSFVQIQFDVSVHKSRIALKF